MKNVREKCVYVFFREKLSEFQNNFQNIYFQIFKNSNNKDKETENRNRVKKNK